MKASVCLAKVGRQRKYNSISNDCTPPNGRQMITAKLGPDRGARAAPCHISQVPKVSFFPSSLMASHPTSSSRPHFHIPLKPDLTGKTGLYPFELAGRGGQNPWQ
jgi:hypothetical protein